MMPDNTTQMLDERYFISVEKMASGWEDEASEAAVNGNPKRSWYLEHMANRARATAGQKLGETKQRIAIERARNEFASSSSPSASLVQSAVLRTGRPR